MNAKREREQSPDDRVLGPKSNKERQREFRKRRRLKRQQPNFVTPPRVIEGSGGLTYHLGGGAKAERREQDYERQRRRGAPEVSLEGSGPAKRLSREVGAEMQKHPTRWA